MDEMLQYLIPLLGVLSVLVAWLVLVTSWRALTRSVTPQIECYLRPRESSQVFDMVIANYGLGCAYDVKLELQVDEDDFNEHHVAMKGWRSTEVPFTVIEPGGRVTNLFGMGPSLLGPDKPPLKPFTATVTYEWQPFWSRRRVPSSRQCTVDIRAFQGLVPEWKKDALAEALKEGLAKLTKTIERPRRPPLPADTKRVDTDYFARMEAAMPDLFAAMKADLAEYPLKREFILNPRSAIYIPGSKTPLEYHYEDHSDLDDKVGLLVNGGAVIDVTFNDVDRYVMSEALVDYLSADKQ